MSHAISGRRRFLAIATSGAVAALLPRASAGAAAPTVRLGYQATLASAVDMIAIEEKLFARRGVAVSVHKFDAGRAVRDAMVSSAIDIGAMGAVPFLIGAAQGEMVGIAIDSYFGGLVLLQVKGNSAIKRIEDLRGTKIGIAVGSLTHSVFIERVAPAFGLKPGDYQVVNTSFGNMTSTLAAGSVDAVVALEPYGSLAEHEGIARTLTSFEKFDPSPNILVARAAFLRDHEPAVIAALRPWLDAAKIFNEDKARAATIVQREYERQGYKVPQKVIVSSLERLKVAPEITADTRKYLVDMAESLRRRSQLNQMPDWNKVLRPDLLPKAIA